MSARPRQSWLLKVRLKTIGLRTAARSALPDAVNAMHSRRLNMGS